MPDHHIRMQPPMRPEVSGHRDKDRPFPTSPEEVTAALDTIAEEEPEYVAAVKMARKAVQAQEQTLGVRPMSPGDDIVVTTLGTGSAVPSKYRNGELLLAWFSEDAREKADKWQSPQRILIYLA
jgi:ribonuclease Z